MSQTEESKQIDTDGDSNRESQEVNIEAAEDNFDQRQMFRKNSILERGKENMFSVTNPKVKGSHVNYTVSGVDSEGPWSGERRYKEFDALQEKLQNNWPGVPIPTLPSKRKAGNNLEQKFVNQRRHYLEQWLKKISNFEYIIESPEFKIFARPAGDIQKQLNLLRRSSPSEICANFRNAFGIQADAYDQEKYEQLLSIIQEYKTFSSKIMPKLLVLRNQKLIQYVQTKDQEIGQTRKFLNILTDYEEKNMATYLDISPDADRSKLIISNVSNDAEYQSGMEQFTKGQFNPYYNIYHWIKGQIFDLRSLNAACEYRAKLFDRIQKSSKKNEQRTQDITNLEHGRKTVKTLFKKTEDMGKIAAKIEIGKDEIGNLQEIHRILTIYLGEHIIPKFQVQQVEAYKKIVQQYQAIQIGNNYQAGQFWSKTLKKNKVE